MRFRIMWGIVARRARWCICGPTLLRKRRQLLPECHLEVPYEKALAEEAESGAGAESGADTEELSGNRPLGARSRTDGAFALSSCLSLKTDGWRNTLVILQICVRSWVIIAEHVCPV